MAIEVEQGFVLTPTSARGGQRAHQGRSPSRVGTVDDQYGKNAVAAAREAHGRRYKNDIVNDKVAQSGTVRSGPHPKLRYGPS